MEMSTAEFHEGWFFKEEEWHTLALYLALQTPIDCPRLLFKSIKAPDPTSHVRGLLQVHGLVITGSADVHGM